MPRKMRTKVVLMGNTNGRKKKNNCNNGKRSVSKILQ
uniref:Uncharacterized protein n=1 Tax=Rhizophora mucronata TaxID=61149 RepID=A0A2P2P1T1_RHIMU